MSTKQLMCAVTVRTLIGYFLEELMQILVLPLSCLSLSHFFVWVILALQYRTDKHVSLCLSPSGVFGQRLEETVLYERRYGVHMAPLVVEQCVDFIRERGLTEVGLFRQPGQATLVKELQEAFDAGEKPSFDRCPYTITHTFTFTFSHLADAFIQSVM